MHASIALPLTTDIEPPCALYRKFLQRGYVKHRSCQAVVKTTFNASTQGRGRGRIRGKIRGRGRGRQIFVNSRPTWSIGQVPGQPGLHRETLSRKKSKIKNLNLVLWMFGGQMYNDVVLLAVIKSLLLHFMLPDILLLLEVFFQALQHFSFSFFFFFKNMATFSFF